MRLTTPYFGDVSAPN